MPTKMEDYLFDLNGYLVLEGAVPPEQVQRLNAAIDAIPPLGNGEWWGHVQGQSYHNEIDGRNYQNIVEGGEAFEEWIDHPGWIEPVRRAQARGASQADPQRCTGAGAVAAVFDRFDRG